MEHVLAAFWALTRALAWALAAPVEAGGRALAFWWRPPHHGHARPQAGRRPLGPGRRVTPCD